MRLVLERSPSQAAGESAKICRPAERHIGRMARDAKYISTEAAWVASEPLRKELKQARRSCD